jgi:signal transduction histidine kinase
MRVINEAMTICPLVDFRIAEEKLQTQITLVLIDNEHCMMVELKDDTRENSYDAAGLSTYSDSKSIVLSYASIFEILWKQNELYEQLKVQDKMQREFINIAAHELRTPIQPILGLTQVIRSKMRDREEQKEEAELLDVISRNATRLQQLTENILDVTKIESKSLQLNKEQFNLRKMLLNAMSDYKSQLKEYSNVRFEFLCKEDIFIEADKTRISQVIYNLLNNAIKFTQMERSKEARIISITLEESKYDDNSKEVIVSIKDTGSGIDPEIIPRLFTKFATKSEKGTGLGLFISKSIIEAHSGRIWAENSSDSKGATFSFSLPIVNK